MVSKGGEQAITEILEVVHDASPELDPRATMTSSALGIIGRPEVLFLDEPTTGFSELSVTRPSLEDTYLDLIESDEGVTASVRQPQALAGHTVPGSDGSRLPELPQTTFQWETFIWLSVVGLTCFTLHGIAFS